MQCVCEDTPLRCVESLWVYEKCVYYVLHPARGSRQKHHRSPGPVRTSVDGKKPGTFYRSSELCFLARVSDGHMKISGRLNNARAGAI